MCGLWKGPCTKDDVGNQVTKRMVNIRYGVSLNEEEEKMKQGPCNAIAKGQSWGIKNGKKAKEESSVERFFADLGNSLGRMSTKAARQVDIGREQRR
jgi:hypothetical protein